MTFNSPTVSNGISASAKKILGFLNLLFCNFLEIREKSVILHIPRGMPPGQVVLAERCLLFSNYFFGNRTNVTHRRVSDPPQLPLTKLFTEKNQIFPNATNSTPISLTPTVCFCSKSRRQLYLIESMEFCSSVESQLGRNIPRWWLFDLNTHDTPSALGSITGILSNHI